MSAKKNLTLSERMIIEKGITNDLTKREIALSVKKDESTIAKEIRLHRTQTYFTPLKLECANYKICKLGRNCKVDCINYVPFKCKRRDKSPGACNGCANIHKCRFNKYKYVAQTAQNEYKELLVSSREGFNQTEEEMKRIADIVCPLLLQKQSPYMIITKHPELKITEKTLYTYIENGCFKKNGVDVMTLRRYVSRKVTKKLKNTYKKRENRAFLKNRLYNDFLSYMDENPNAKVIEMDTVYNNISTGPYMQTFKFLEFGLLIAIYRKEKTAASMVEGLNILQNVLGLDLFKKYVHICKTDRGTEFVNVDELENTNDGLLRMKVFYCDPMASSQKGSLENIHEELRYFFPKEKNLTNLGLTSQENLNIVLSHLNSAPKEKLNGKSPLELVQFLAPDLYLKLVSFGITAIPSDNVVLDISVLKNK